MITISTSDAFALASLCLASKPMATGEHPLVELFARARYQTERPLGGYWGGLTDAERAVYVQCAREDVEGLLPVLRDVFNESRPV